MFGLEDRHIKLILEILNKHAKNAKFYIFGSRARGDYSRYSDIDIAIDGAGLNSDILSKINSEFDNSTMPYEVDVIDINSISSDFKKMILNDLIELK